MQKVLLLLFIFLFHGCNLNTLFLGGEIDKVMVVKYTPYMKHHRAYFTRTHLKNIRGRKYLFLHNPTNNDLAVLFHYQNKYMLYNMSQPERKPLVSYTHSKSRLEDVLKSFKHKGYVPIHSLSSIGYTTSVAKRLYKGIKTLLIETRDYRRLQSLYKKAIKGYDAQSIRYIKTKLPKPLIYPYYRYYKKHAQSKVQKAQLQTIGEKLHLEKIQETHTSLPKKLVKKPVIKPVTKLSTKPLKDKSDISNKRPLLKKSKEKETTPIKKVQRVAPAIIIVTKPFRYYLHQASLAELSSYISNKATKNALSYNQYTALSHRKTMLKEEKLFNEGTLEELIEAYKTNKNPKYKKRIMLLMKKQQEAAL